MCWLIRHWWRWSPLRWEIRQCRICGRKEQMKFNSQGKELWVKT